MVVGVVVAAVVVAAVVVAVAVVAVVAVVVLKALWLLVWEAVERSPPVEHEVVVEGFARMLGTMQQVVADPRLMLLLLQ